MLQIHPPLSFVLLQPLIDMFTYCLDLVQSFSQHPRAADFLKRLALTIIFDDRGTKRSAFMA